jgi:hypothetical protein
MRGTARDRIQVRREVDWSFHHQHMKDHCFHVCEAIFELESVKLPTSQVCQQVSVDMFVSPFFHSEIF